MLVDGGRVPSRFLRDCPSSPGTRKRSKTGSLNRTQRFPKLEVCECGAVKNESRVCARVSPHKKDGDWQLLRKVKDEKKKKIDL